MNVIGKRRWPCIVIILVIITSGVIILGICAHQLLLSLSSSGYYETNNIEDYGKYIYTYGENRITQEYIDRFFPSEILDDFQNVEYIYHSNSVDSYSFEAFLSITFNDQESLNAHVQSVTTGMIKQPFFFDSSYDEYVLMDMETGFVYDHIMLGERYADENGASSYQIESAKIAKILVNYENLEVVYIALAVHDGGGTDTSFLNTYFSRFGINPKEYEIYTNKSDY